MPDQPPQSTWQRLWGVLMGRDALQKAASQGSPSPSPPPQNQDTSVVRKAAEEAGRRMEEEKASKLPTPLDPKRYRLGGVIRPRIAKYGKYPRSISG